MKNVVILENIRSAYNTGNIIRTADALGRDVVLSGFTPDPEEKKQVAKTSLGAEEKVIINQFWNTNECLKWIREQGYYMIAAEISDVSISICGVDSDKPVALIMGNENTGVLQETLDSVNQVAHIPMEGMKESLNVGQAAAIMMWEIGNQ